MKSSIKSALIASTLIVTGVTFAGAAMADNTHKVTGPGAHSGMHGMHRQPVDIAALLGLDAARSAQVNTILADERTQRKALWEANKGSAHDDASKAAFRTQMKALREASKTKLTAVLTAEELQKLRDSMPKHGPQGMKQG